MYVYKRDMDDFHGDKPNISGCATTSRKSSKFRGPSSVAPLCAKAYARDETGQIHSNMVRTGIWFFSDRNPHFSNPSCRKKNPSHVGMGQDMSKPCTPVHIKLAEIYGCSSPFTHCIYSYWSIAMFSWPKSSYFSELSICLNFHHLNPEFSLQFPLFMSKIRPFSQ